MAKHNAKQSAEHQSLAIRAARDFGFPAEIASVETLKLSQKSQVHRLKFVNSDSAVIAKCGSASNVQRDCDMFDLLRGFGLYSPVVYGTYPTELDERVWLFMEDCGDLHPKLSRQDHRDAVSQWAGALHVAGTEATDLALPSRDVTYYAKVARTAADSLRCALDGIADPGGTSSGHRELARMCLAAAALLESATSLAAEVPKTIVHGDLVPKNLLIVPKPGTIQVVCLDWETVGIGPPAPDLQSVDHHTYRQRILRDWPKVTASVVERQASLGLAARLVQAVEWEVRSFLHLGSRERASRHFALYQESLGPALATLERTL